MISSLDINDVTVNPLVSIIIRTKDRPELLKRATHSIAGQTYRPIEVVLVNDGGCDLNIDELRGILEEDIHLNYIKLKTNTGRPHAGNVGIEHACGAYIGFLDDDDVFYPYHIETLIEAFQESDYKISYTDAEVVHLAESHEGGEIQEGEGFPRESIDFSFETLLLQNYISFMTLLFRKTVLVEIGGFDEGFDLCEDWDLIIRLGSRYPFHHIRKITAKYSFWSEEHQVTIGNEKLHPYRLKILLTHIAKITPQVLYSLAYEGKFLGEIKMRDRKDFLEGKMTEIEKILMTLKLEKERLEFDLNERNCQLHEIRGSKIYKLLSPLNKFITYYDKSRQVIKHIGWKTFFFKAKHKILSKISIVRMVQSPKQKNISGVMLRMPQFPTPRKFSTVFIVNPNESFSNYFRAYNMNEYLKDLSIENEVISEIALDYEHILTFDIVVLVRVVISPHIEKIIQMCNELRIPVIYDIDDYLLQPSIVDHMAALDNVTEYEKQRHRKGMQLFRAVFDAADFFTAPTNYLAEVGKNIGKPSFVIRNGLNFSQIEVCKEILDAKTPLNDNQILIIGYFSGTNTHQKDFLVAAPSLLRIMNEFPGVQLNIGGYLDLDSRFEKFSNRIKKVPFVDRDKLPYNIAEVDINIVPLEVNNPYCEAKSELKYFDSGLLEIPTVASSTATFKSTIRHGDNGFLAGSSEEWYDCLKRLINDPALRRRMGQRAHEQVKKYYSPDYMASSAVKIYENIILEYRRMIGISEDALKIGFVVPPPIEGSGGHNKIFTAAKYLSESGHLVILYFLNDGAFGGQEQLKDFICSHFFNPRCEIILGTDNIHSCDALCATSWITAYTVKENKNKAAKLFYFVQDFECLFFPMSDSYLKAENTYRLGMHHIAFGPWCAKLLKEGYNAKVDHIPFSINKELYYPRIIGKKKNKNIIFFARPEMPRRCFNLGIEALTLFHKKTPGVKIILFGSKLIDTNSIAFPHENLGVLKTEELSMLYSSADVGIAFSTTNPSLVPFEMMACGCPVIDFDYHDNHINYGSRENVKLVGISPEEIANGIEEMIKDDDMRRQIAGKGVQFVSGFPDDKETFKAMEEIFLKAFGIEKTKDLRHAEDNKIFS